MRTRTLGLLGLVAAFAVALPAAASAQTLHVRADIPFSFQAEGKTLPAGRYEFTEIDNGAIVRVAGASGENAVLMPTLTRVAAEVHGHADDSHVVFDVVNGVHTLSEVWSSGSDGFLVSVTKAAHTHKVITTTGRPRQTS